MATTPSLSTDNLQALFTFPFKDPKWKEKFIIGGLVIFSSIIIPLVPLFAYAGYMVRVKRQILRHNAEPSLPEWDNWGDLLVDGVKYYGAAFIVSLPLMILFFVGYVVMMGSMLPLALAEANREMVGPALLIQLGGLAVGMVLFAIGSIASLLIGFTLPAGLCHMIAQDDFAAAFRVKEWWPIFRSNLGGFALAFVLIYGLGMVLAFAVQILYITLILCCLVPFLLCAVSVYLSVIYAVLYAQAYQGGVARLNVQAGNQAIG